MAVLSMNITKCYNKGKSFMEKIFQMILSLLLEVHEPSFYLFLFEFNELFDSWHDWNFSKLSETSRIEEISARCYYDVSLPWG